MDKKEKAKKIIIPKKPKNEKILLRLPETTIAEYDSLAELSEVSRAELMRHALNEFLNTYKKETGK